MISIDARSAGIWAKNGGINKNLKNFFDGADLLNPAYIRNRFFKVTAQ